MQLSANGVRLEVEIHGPADGEPLLLIMGLGMQLIAWPDGLVDQLVARGFRVIRYDHRDIGLSQPFDELGPPNLALGALLHALHLPLAAPYRLADLACDAVGLLDALGIARAHVCGASMGGMVAQHLGFSHGERLKSLTLMMTTSGDRRLPRESLRVRRALLSRPRPALTPAQWQANVVEHVAGLYDLIGSPAYRPDAAELRQRIRERGRVLLAGAEAQGIVDEGRALFHHADRALRDPAQLHHPLRQQVHVLRHRPVDLVEQLVQGDERRSLHVPVRLLHLRFQIDRFRQARLQDGDDLLAGVRRDVEVGLIHFGLLD